MKPAKCSQSGWPHQLLLSLSSKLPLSRPPEFLLHPSPHQLLVWIGGSELRGASSHSGAGGVSVTKEQHLIHHCRLPDCMKLAKRQLSIKCRTTPPKKKRDQTPPLARVFFLPCLLSAVLLLNILGEGLRVPEVAKPPNRPGASTQDCVPTSESCGS